MGWSSTIAVPSMLCLEGSPWALQMGRRGTRYRDHLLEKARAHSGDPGDISKPEKLNVSLLEERSAADRTIDAPILCRRRIPS